MIDSGRYAGGSSPASGGYINISGKYVGGSGTNSAKVFGVKIDNPAEPWCHEATRDNIRHYAHGIGDDNPLWCDPDYAAGTHYGGIVALPSFLFSTNRIISGYVGGLPGI